VVLALVGSILVPSTASAQKKVPNGAKVLLLTGGARQHHGYRDQAFYLSGVLEDTGRFEVTLAEDAAILETPAMAKYDLIIVNADRRDPEFKFTKSQQEALLNWVKAGHGYVSIHGADNAAPDWIPEWREMLGGVFSHIGLPDSKTKKGTFTPLGHRDFGPGKDDPVKNPGLQKLLIQGISWVAEGKNAAPATSAKP
jgi:hypothetical protein